MLLVGGGGVVLALLMLENFVPAYQLSFHTVLAGVVNYQLLLDVREDFQRAALALKLINIYIHDLFVSRNNEQQNP